MAIVQVTACFAFICLANITVKDLSSATLTACDSFYNGHLRGRETITLIAERLSVKLSQPFLRIRFIEDGIGVPIYRMRGECCSCSILSIKTFVKNNIDIPIFKKQKRIFQDKFFSIFKFCKTSFTFTFIHINIFLIYTY